MGSRKEEERNEKIIRGLMKLPPNRHCINCNSLGPQYVCTNFWTFVCMSCSGIHREFTHRVKSVSMSKFTSQEVEALQNGGNQRAREIYLKEWDQQRQRLPLNSNIDKVREFIKNVYVDKRYAGGKTGDKPPKDSQSIRSPEDETRRASSYHSYSQSPPYDFQYEDRRYGKQATTLTRKPGSDRGFYVGKMSSFISSPNRISDKVSEDRFANEGSSSRPSNYSVSSGGDSVRCSIESPSFHKDVRSSSLPNHPSRETKRAPSLGSIGSFDSNSMSLKSCNSGGFGDFASESGVLQDSVSTFPQSSASVSHGSLDLFDTSIVPESNCSAGAPIDLFQLPAKAVASSTDLFHTYQVNSDPPMSGGQHSQVSLPSSLGFIAESGITGAQSNAALDNKSSESSAPRNEGWATFDVPLPAGSSSQGIGNLSPSVMHYAGGLSPEIDHASKLNTNMQWSIFLNSVGQRSSASVPQQGSLYNVRDIGNSTNAQEWNAFDASTEIPVKGIKQNSEPKVEAYKPLSDTNCYFDPSVSEDFNHVGTERAVYFDELAAPSALSAPSGPFDTIMGSSFTPANPPMEETRLHTDHRSMNPFDLPYDSESEQGNMLLDMSSLQAALPHAQLPPTFLGGVTESWFTQDPMMTYIPAPQGSLAYMAGQAPGPQLANVQAQEPVASVGGNPFA